MTGAMLQTCFIFIYRSKITRYSYTIPPQKKLTFILSSLSPYQIVHILLFSHRFPSHHDSGGVVIIPSQRWVPGSGWFDEDMPSETAYPIPNQISEKASLASNEIGPSLIPLVVSGVSVNQPAPGLTNSKPKRELTNMGRIAIALPGDYSISEKNKGGRATELTRLSFDHPGANSICPDTDINQWDCPRCTLSASGTPC